ncbi:MAG: hypothetical protein K8R67_08625 [Desulfobacteraceae bacterium]|nr:hypothetical protein [Desulfobacteraceae bacterium]
MTCDDQWAKDLINDLRLENKFITEEISSQLLSLLEENLRDHNLTKKERTELADDLIIKITKSPEKTDVD